MSASFDLVDTAVPLAWTSYSAPLSASTWGVSTSDWFAIWSDVTFVTLNFHAFDLRGEILLLDNFSMTGFAPPVVPSRPPFGSARSADWA